MKKLFLSLIVLGMTITAFAQRPNAANSFQLNINTFSEKETAKINQYIEQQRNDRSFIGTLGMAVLNTIVMNASSDAISGIMDLTELPQRQKSEWERMIEKECNYSRSLTYVNSLTDFYSKGSTHGALDPSDFNFNGFTLKAERNGKEVLRFYCHVNTDETGLHEIVNHSKFSLVLDSMYFYPYQCHLPNLSANGIYPEKDKTYDRSVYFNFEDREDLSIDIDFTITSSWYNQAIMLFQDVELGSFNIQVPIDKDDMIDSVFVYKRGTPDQQPLYITGSSFIVPRSYMPLTEGAQHWGTGEYNVAVTFSEHCDISQDIRDHWRKDYRSLKKMRKNQSFWPTFSEYCVQQGTTLLRFTLETASSNAIREWDWLNQ